MGRCAVVVVGGFLGIKGDGTQHRSISAPETSPHMLNPAVKKGHRANHRPLADSNRVCDLALGEFQKLSRWALGDELQDVAGDFAHSRGVRGLGSRLWTGFLCGFHGQQGPQFVFLGVEAQNVGRLSVGDGSAWGLVA